jgi:hypothetical protein
MLSRWKRKRRRQIAVAAIENPAAKCGFPAKEAARSLFAFARLALRTPMKNR